MTQSLSRLPRAELERAAFATLALWPVLAFLLYSVYIRIQSKYFTALLSASGLSADGGLVNQVFLYRNDLLLIGVLCPLLALLSIALVRRRGVFWAWGLGILLAQLLLYANLQTWGQVGRFFSWQALINAIAFGMSNPEFVGEYLALDGIAKLTALLLASWAVLLAARRLPVGSLVMRFGAFASVAGMVAAAATAAYGYSSDMKRAPISGSFFLNAMSSLVEEGARPPAAAKPGNLDVELERLTGVPVDDYRGPRFGAAIGKNLVMFVLETGSIEFLDVRQALPDHAVFKRLAPATFMARNHLSTFPASAESNLSILTGLYPPRALYDTCLVDVRATAEGRPALPGVIPALRRAGYKTALYAPFRSQVPADKVVFEYTGFERVFYGQDNNPGTGGSDPRTFKELLKDVSDWSRNGEKFAVAYFPQIGHGPWSPSLGATIKERGAKLVMRQMDWLNEVVTELERAGQLDKTVIVLTGDHGVRTSLEDPRVRVGMIDDYSLHVPLLVYAPNIDYSNVDPDQPSSHVDLGVELAQLFGVPRTPTMQGLPFGHPKQAVRRQFLMANWYFGADGYRDATESAMYTSMLDVAYRREDRKVDFRTKDLVKDADQTKRIRRTLDDMLDLQDAWVLHRACGQVSVPH